MISHSLRNHLNDQKVMTNVVNMNKYPPIYDLYPEFLSLFEGFFIQKEPSVLEGSTYAHLFYKLLLTATSLMISTQPSIPKVLEFNEIS